MTVEGTDTFHESNTAWSLSRIVTRGPKRAFDIAVAATVLVFAAPLMAVVAILVSRDGGPVLFGHERIGRNGKRFRCLKFRSMVVNADEVLAAYLEQNPSARAEWEERRKISNDPRVNKVGQFLRKSSLDELPQLFNVLRGEMSIIGPRPVVDDELPRYGRRVHHYLNCRPGLTGLWQVKGRSSTTYRRRVAFDTAYAKQRNFAMDLQILMLTVPAVLFRVGAE